MSRQGAGDLGPVSLFCLGMGRLSVGVGLCPACGGVHFFGFVRGNQVPESRQGSQGLKEITKGLLDPRWVEALMGWPLGFLGLELPGFGRRAEGKSKSPGSPLEPADEPRSGGSN